MRKFPYLIELNASGAICSFVQEEEISMLSDWQQQQTTKAKKTVNDFIGIVAISHKTYLLADSYSNLQ
jgi:hypothetical protein